MVALVAIALGLLVVVGQPVTSLAADTSPALPDFGAGFDPLAGLGEAADEPVTITARVEQLPDGGSQLVVVASLADGWHLYSLDQKPGGPKATSITVAGDSPLLLAGRFLAAPPATKKTVSDVPGWEGLTIEEHAGVVTWTAPLKPNPSGTARAVHGSVSLQLCEDNACTPPQTIPFTATAAGEPPAGPPAGASLPPEPLRHLPERGHRTETGRISMSKQHRARWVALGISEVVNAWADWEHARKFRRTYAEKMTEPRLHPKWNPLLNSGRFSATGTIALQTLPKCGGTPRDRLSIRQLVIPPEGSVFVAVDFSQIEVVALAAVMETQTGYGSGLADVIRGGLDVHGSIAHCLYPERYGPITAGERKAVKPITFGLPGGMGPRTIQQVAKLNYGLDLELHQVEAIVAAYKRLAPELEQHLASRVCPGMQTANFLGMRTRGEGWQMLNVLGGTASTFHGIPLTEEEESPFWAMADRFKPILPGNKKTRAALERAIDNREPSPTLTAAIRNTMTEELSCTMTGRLRARCNFRSARNNTFQGLAADGAILAMWKLFRHGFSLAMFVHDEIVATCPNDGRTHMRADVMSEIMRTEMAQVLGGKLPVGVEAFVSASFSQRDKLAPGEVAASASPTTAQQPPPSQPTKATTTVVQGPAKRKAAEDNTQGSGLSWKTNPKAISCDDELGDIPF